MPTQPEKVYRLNDLEVHEVSLVDAPANQRKFLVVKNVAGDQAVGKTTDEVDAIMADKAEAETHLFAKLHPDVQAKAGTLLTKAGERLLALAQAVKAAKAEDSAEAAIPDKLLDEVVHVLDALAGLAPQAKDAAAAMADPDKKPKPKPGEKQSDDEKKKPPFKAGALDELAAVIDKADMSDEMLSVLYLTAGKEALRMAQDSVYDNEFGPAAKYAHMAFMYLAKYGSGMGVPMQMAEDLAALSDKLAPIVKAGRKMSAARWAELDKSLRALLALAEEVRPGYLAEVSGVPKGVNKSDVDRLVEILRQKDETIKSLRGGARPDTNAMPTGEAPPRSSDFAWPSDLNADYNEFDEADKF